MKTITKAQYLYLKSKKNAELLKNETVTIEDEEYEDLIQYSNKQITPIEPTSEDYLKSYETEDYIFFKDKNLLIKKIHNFNSYNDYHGIPLNNEFISGQNNNIICIDDNNLDTYSFFYVTGASPYLAKIINMKILKNKNYIWDLSIKTGTYSDYVIPDANEDYILDVNNLNIEIIEYDPETFEILGNI